MCMEVKAPAMNASATCVRAGCSSSLQSQMAPPKRQTCMHQYRGTELKVASYGTGMCQNHSDEKNTSALIHRGQPACCAPTGISSAINGAAMSTRTMCCPTRAEKSATDN